MSKYNTNIRFASAKIALRSLYRDILATKDSIQDAKSNFVVSVINRHHYAELKAFARIFQAPTTSSIKDELSGIHAILIKPLNDLCNLRCTYCYEGQEEFRSRGELMSQVHLERILKEILNSPKRDIQFLWHGGEPLLAGIDFYKHALDIQREANIHGIEIYNGIQTNGTLLNQKWIDFLAEHNFGISLSLDGPKFLHDQSRIDFGSNGTYERVINLLIY
jgi:sulfatase maturation enzyme AslB (radical SAM superfamily)